MILYYYALFTTGCWLLVTLYLLVSKLRMRFLRSVAVPADTAEPPVVIIIAVRNEEAELANALQSVCQLQYTHYRLLLINDRSTDRTPLIMERFAALYPHITVMHIDTLPKGWLGKNHALQRGYEASTEEWMLFTDADVVYKPDTLKKAMWYTRQQGLDHLTVLPHVQSRSLLLNSVLGTFALLLELKQRPWDLRNPSSSASLGVGAFNLVRRTAYEKAGTHKAIALRPDDDLKLGERIKATGGVQDALYGNHQISLEWYTSVKEFINGLMKNNFSVFDYQLWKVIGAVLPLILFFILPLPLLLLLGGTRERLLVLVLLIIQVLLFVLQRGGLTRWWYALLIPYAGALMSYIMLRSAFLTLKQKGIYWRDSFYPLDELRKKA